MRNEKTICYLLYLAVFAMSFTVPENNEKEAPVPASFSFTIKWDPSNCNCQTVQYKLLDWTLTNYNMDPSQEISSGSNVVVTGTDHPVSGSHMYFDVDCRICYYLEATIKYYDSSGLCCSETDGVWLSGDRIE